MNEKREQLNRRHRSIRARISGTSEIPRLQVFRSLKYIYAYLIDDEQGITIATANDKQLITKESKKNKVDRAFDVGQKIAEKAKEKKIKKVVFDRRGYLYHGRVKSVAEGARKGGLNF